MTRNYACIYFLLPLVCLMSACGSGEGGSTVPVEKQVAAASKPRAGSDAVTLTSDIAGKLKWHEVAEGRLPRRLAVTGKVQFNEDQTARVLAPVPGQVVDLHVHVGDAVNDGTLLFSLRSREVVELMTDYLESRRDLDLAEKTLAMTKDLYDHQGAARIALQQAESEAAKDKAKVAHAAQGLRILGLDPPGDDMFDSLNTLIKVRSPISGTIVERVVTTGQFVQPEAGSLLTIADLSTVWVLADVFERDVRFIRPGLRAEVTTTAYPDQKFTARVVRLHDVVDPETRTVKVRFLVSNPELRLKPEMFASVALFLADAEHTVTIPTAAVFAEDGSNYTFVQEPDNQVRRRRLELSTEGGNEVRVVSGLRAGEKVVSEGVLMLRELERGDQ